MCGCFWWLDVAHAVLSLGFLLSKARNLWEWNGVRSVTVLRDVLGVKRLVVEGARFDESGALVVCVRPWKSLTSRCGVCRRKCVGFDQGRGRRRWRSLDLGSTIVWLQADAPRVRCGVHGVVVSYVPWARHGSGHTRDFDDQIAWLATKMSKTAVTELMRVAWRTVGSIIERVWADTERGWDRLGDCTVLVSTRFPISVDTST